MNKKLPQVFSDSKYAFLKIFEKGMSKNLSQVFSDS